MSQNQDLRQQIELSTETSEDIRGETLKAIYTWVKILEDFKAAYWEDSDKYRSAVKEYEDIRKATIESLKSSSTEWRKIVDQELSLIKLELSNLDNLKDKTESGYWNHRGAVDTVLDKASWVAKSIWLSTDTLSWLWYDTTNLNTNQDELIAEILGWEELWFSNKFVKWYNNEIWNHLIKIEDFEKEIKNHNILEVNTKWLENYFKYLETKKDVIEYLLENFKIEKLLKIKEILNQNYSNKITELEEKIKDWANLKENEEKLKKLKSLQKIKNKIAPYKKVLSQLEKWEELWKKVVEKNYNNKEWNTFIENFENKIKNKYTKKIKIVNWEKPWWKILSEYVKNIKNKSDINTAYINIKKFFWEEEKQIKKIEEVMKLLYESLEEDKEDKVKNEVENNDNIGKLIKQWLNIEKEDEDVYKKLEKEFRDYKLKNNEKSYKEIIKWFLEEKLKVTESKYKKDLEKILSDLLEIQYYRSQSEVIKEVIKHLDGKITKEELKEIILKKEIENYNKTHENKIEYKNKNTTKTNNDEIYSKIYETQSLKEISPNNFELKTKTWETLIITQSEKDTIYDNEGKIKNPEALNNLVNFKLTLDELNISFIWTHREKYIKAMDNLNIQIDNDTISKEELRKILNYTLKVIWETEEHDTLSSAIAKIREINWAGLDEEAQNIFWRSRIEQKFWDRWYINPARWLSIEKIRDKTLWIQETLWEYEVKSWDSLWKIVKKNLESGASNTDIANKVNEIKKLNPEIGSWDLIKPWKKLKLHYPKTKKD